MQLSHKTVGSEDIRRYEQDIAWYKKSIGRYQEIARKDKDGIAELVLLLKDAQIQSQIQLNDSLLKPNPDTSMLPPMFAAEVRIYGFVLELLENPKKLIEDNQRKLEVLEKHVSGLKKLSRRD